MRYLRYLFVLMLLGPVLPGRAHAADPVAADLYIDYDNRGGAEVWLYPYTKSPPRDVGALRRALEKALGAPLTDVFHTVDRDGDWYLTASAGDPSLHLVQSRPIALSPLVAALRGIGVPGVDAFVTHPRAGHSRFDGAEREEDEEGSTEYVVSAPPHTEPMVISYGYPAGALARLFFPFAVILLLPIGATLRMRRLALRAVGKDPAAVWFGYWRFLNIQAWAAWVLWMAMGFLFPTEHCLNYFIDLTVGESFAVEMALFILPMAFVLMACTMLSHDVFTRFRGVKWTRGDTWRQTAWTYGAGFIPLLMLMAGIGMVIDENARLAAAAFLLAYGTRLFSAQALARANEMEPHALMVGPLRDRIFALAEQAGVRLQQLYVLPAGRGRLVNAFAVSGQIVMMSEEMLRRFSGREVDAIAAHELSHLRKKHTALWRPFLTYALIFAGVAAMSAFAETAPDMWSLRLLVPLPLMVIGIGNLFFSRRREAAADKGAVELTGDPEAMITALAKLSRLNRLPIEWSRWDERVLTHPSSRSRADVLARAAGISSERLETLLQDAVEPEDRYEVPAGARPEETVFSTRAKQSFLMRFGWTHIIARSLVPALFALLATQYPAWRVPIYATGVLATVAVWLLLHNRLNGVGYAPLRRAMARKMEARGLVPGEWGGTFVGFSPHGAPRLYEHFTEWDLGFLFLTRESLAYAGEQATFGLRREELREVSVVKGSPGVLSSAAIFVSWEAGGRSGCFRLEMAGEASRRRASRAARALAERIGAWRAGVPEGPDAPEALAGVAAPAIGEVTSQSPREWARGETARSTILLVGLVAFGLSLLMGLPVAPGEGGGALYAAAVAVGVTLLEIRPYRSYREPADAEPPLARDMSHPEDDAVAES